MMYQNSFLPLTGMAENLGLSRQNISSEIDKLEKSGMVRYSIIENPNLQDIRTFFIEIKTNPEEPEIVSKLNEIKGIISLDGIIGQNSLMAKFHARNNREFSEILEKIDSIIARTRFQHYKIIDCLKTFKDGGKDLSGSPREGREKVTKEDIEVLDVLKDMDSKFSFKKIHACLEKITNKNTYPRIRRIVKKLIERKIINSFTIKIAPKIIEKTDFIFKFFLEIIPKNLTEYNILATEILVNEEKIVELYRTGE
ncbi:MAG: hypothetical protein ACFFCS_30050, partial [Candidatus Hodarchaeota archaeon]